MNKAPNSRRNLDIAINRSFGPDAVEFRRLMAAVFVARLSDCLVLKGGSALKIRYGVEKTRSTTDLDAVSAVDRESFESSFAKALADGWEGFGGKLILGRQASPKDVPFEYVMQPYKVKLTYLGSPWITVRLEVGHDEIGDASFFDLGLSRDVESMFAAVGLAFPGPVRLLWLPYQIAQKLHGLSSLGSKRAHDLIDLQVIVANSEIDFAETKRVCERLFAYRKMQAWPPTIIAGDCWNTLYDAQSEGLSVLPTVLEAVEWANALIARIAAER